MNIETKRLTLIRQTPQDALDMVEAMTPEDRAQVSPVWLEKLRTAPDPWMLGYRLVHRESGAAVGNCLFKTPPSTEGKVEIAYGIDPQYQNQGYATEAAQALVEHAFQTGQVRVVLAHTLSEPNASTRVLAKCGFTNVGEVIDPEDGRVWRWERRIG